MANPLAKLSPAAKKTVIVLTVILLVATGVGATVMSKLSAKVDPAAAGLSVAPSSKSLPPSVSSGRASVQVAQTQMDLLLLQLEEAWRNGDWNKSIEILSTIVAANPGNASMLDRLYQAHVNLGWQLLVNNKFAEAKVQFSLALKIKANGTEALEGLRLVEQLAITPTVIAPTATPVAPAPTQAPACTATAVAVCTPQAPVSCPGQPVTTCPTGFTCYVVRTGDTLFSLARRFNTSIEAILAANKLSCCTIFVCQQLLIPVGTCAPVCPTAAPAIALEPCPPVCVPICAPVCPQIAPHIHVVRKGDNLFRLAIQFNTTVGRLMQANGLRSTTIRIGQALVIP